MIRNIKIMVILLSAVFTCVLSFPAEREDRTPVRFSFSFNNTGGEAGENEDIPEINADQYPDRARSGLGAGITGIAIASLSVPAAVLFLYFYIDANARPGGLDAAMNALAVFAVAFFGTIGIVVAIAGIGTLMILLGFNAYRKYRSKKMPDPFAGSNGKKVEVGFKFELKGCL